MQRSIDQERTQASTPTPVHFRVGLLLLAMLDGCAEPKSPCVYSCESSDETSDSNSQGGQAGEPGPNDRDGDGWTPDGGDCNDHDASVHPEAPEDNCDGVDSNCDGIVEAAMVGGLGYDDLQDAIDDSVEGGKVLVCPGIHYGGFELPHSLTLEGYTDDAKASILDGEHRHPVVSSQYKSVTLRSLTIQNGLSTYDGGGVRARHAENLSINNVVFQNNHASVEGGGLFWTPDTHRHSILNLTDSVFAGNTSGYGGGGAMLGSVYHPVAARIEDTLFRGNSASFEGGAVAIHALNQDNAVIFTRTTFDGNTAENSGGAIINSSWNVGTVTLRGCHATNNEALYGAAYSFEGWSSSRRGSVLIDGGSITKNGIHNGTYGALYANEQWDVEVSNVDFGWGSADNHNDISGCDPFDSTASFFYSPGEDLWCE